MKTHKLFAIAMISLVAAMPGCGGDDDDDSANGGSAGRTTGGASARGGAGGSGGTAGSRGGTTQTGSGGVTQTASGGTAGGAAAGNANRGGATQAGFGGVGGDQGGSMSNPGGAGAGGWTQGEAGGGAGGSGGEVAMLTDAQILQIAIVANEGEVAEGEVAAAKASHDTVKAFAQEMIDDHTQAAMDARAVATASGLAPTPSAVSTALEAQAQATIAALNSLAQPQFDPAYMAAQVNAHQSVLVLVNEALLPQAENMDLRAYLVTMRTSVQTHLTAAAQIAADL